MAAGRSVAEKEKLRLGREISSKLRPIRSQSEVAKELGISRQAVERCEQIAMGKIALRLKELLAQ